MITDVISPATLPSTEATHPANPQLMALPSDYAIALTRDGVATLSETLNTLRAVQHYLVEDPTLIPHFAPERSNIPLEVADSGKVQIVAAMYADILNIGLHNLSAVPVAKSESAWVQYCHHMLANSAAVRAEVTRKPWGYPRLSVLAEYQEPHPVQK